MSSAQGLLFEAALAFFRKYRMKTRVDVYVDGMNLFYGALKCLKFKWLNLVKLAYWFSLALAGKILL